MYSIIDCTGLRREQSYLIRFVHFCILGHHDSDGLLCTEDFGLKSCRRMRTVFSAEQLQKLEEVFSKQRYMTGSEKVLLASALRLTETQVKVWFQNRRTKWRKSREVEQRPKDKCSDLKHETCMSEDGEFKDTDEISWNVNTASTKSKLQTQATGHLFILVKQEIKAWCHYVAL